jgi:nucleoid DNA-binding protein
MTEQQILDAMVGETGMGREQAAGLVHSVVVTIQREFQNGSPVINCETGTLDLVIDRQALVERLCERVAVSAADAQNLIDAMIGVMAPA